MHGCNLYSIMFSRIIRYLRFCGYFTKLPNLQFASVWRINKNWPVFQDPSNIPLYLSHELSHGTLGSINYDLSRGG